MSRQSITDIRANEDVQSIFLLGMASLQQSRNGPYWRLELRDATGAVEAKIWSPLSGSYPDLAAGQMVEIHAKAGLFRDQIQVTIDKLRVLNDEERAALDLGQFMRASSRSATDMMAELEALCDKELLHAPWRTFATHVLTDPAIRLRLLVAPAAKSVHHAYVSGLLEHILSVASLSMRIADNYPEVDRQVLLAGAMFHDIGKLDEMSGGMVNDYTDSGRFLGHIVQGLIMLEPYLAQARVEPELALHFRHLMASHHGTLEFGSPREPATAEAFILHYADNIDAKLAQLRGLFPSVQQETRAAEGEGQASMLWSPWQSLLNRSLCRAVPTPSTSHVANNGECANISADVNADMHEDAQESGNAQENQEPTPEPEPEPEPARDGAAALNGTPEPDFMPCSKDISEHGAEPECDPEPEMALEPAPVTEPEHMHAASTPDPTRAARPHAPKELQCSLL